MNILARLCGTKYRLSHEVLRQGGLDAATLVLENLKLPGSTATPRLLRKGIYDAMVLLFALAAAGHLASVQAALAASPSILRVTDLITGDAQADHAKYYKLLAALATCSAEDWTRLATVPVGKYAVDIGTRQVPNLGVAHSHRSRRAVRSTRPRLDAKERTITQKKEGRY